MAELNALAGAHIARLVGVEGAHVTSGSAGGLLLAAAACIAGDDPERIAAAPRHRRDAERDRDPAVRPDPVRPGAPHGRRRPGRGRRRGRLHAGGDRGGHRAADRRAHLHRLARARRARRGARAHGRHRPRPRAAADRRRRVHPAAGRPPHALDGHRRRPRDPERGQGHPRARRTPACSSAAPTSSAPPRPTARPTPPSGGPARSARRPSSAWSPRSSCSSRRTTTRSGRGTSTRRAGSSAPSPASPASRLAWRRTAACTPPPPCCSRIDRAATGLTPDEVMHALRRGEPPIMVRVSRASSWWTPTACAVTRRPSWPAGSGRSCSAARPALTRTAVEREPGRLTEPTTRPKSMPAHSFPTTVIGSLPRPAWVRDVILDRKAGRLAEAEADRLLDAAVDTAVRLQERAGPGRGHGRRVAPRELRQGLRGARARLPARPQSERRSPLPGGRRAHRVPPRDRGAGGPLPAGPDGPPRQGDAAVALHHRTADVAPRALARRVPDAREARCATASACSGGRSRPCARPGPTRCSWTSRGSPPWWTPGSGPRKASRTSATRWTSARTS